MEASSTPLCHTHGRTHALAYDVHGLRIGVSSDAALAAALEARLGLLPAADPTQADLAFAFSAVDDPLRHPIPRPPESARPVYDSDTGGVLYHDDTDSLYITCGDRVRLVCNPARGRVQVSTVRPRPTDLWLLSHPLLTLPLMESAKRQGLFCLHAAGVALDGKCLLLPADSGSGKSTLALALAQRGWDLLGDDLVFLQTKQGRLRALAFPEAIDLTDDAAHLFPELRNLWNGPLLPGWPKRQLSPTACFGSRIAWVCEPAAIVFPRIAFQERSVLAPIDRDTALLQLAPNVLLTETRSSQAHLETLADLLAASDCYRLETGHDFDALATLLRGLMH